jgi:hypothetical protein
MSTNCFVIAERLATQEGGINKLALLDELIYALFPITAHTS